MLLTLLLWLNEMNAQEKVLTAEAFTAVVKKFHPVAKMAANDVKMAKWNITSSRASFDPEWKSDTYRKEFGGVTYYDQRVHEIKIPTWYGIDVYAGKETLEGDRLNPEKTSGSVNYVGVSVPLLQNLVMDKRRAALLLAKNYYRLSEVERSIAVNDLLREAMDAYWTWWQKHYEFELMQKGLANAKKRFDFIKAAYRLGDRPAVDTLEALTQVQSFEIKVSESFAEYTSAQLSLSAFLWTENLAQAGMVGVTPGNSAAYERYIVEEMLSASQDHPELRQYQYKLKGLQIEKALRFQAFLPDVRIKYNQLGRSFSGAMHGAWFSNNFSNGISIALPLRFSEGRGEFAKARIGIENTKIEQGNKQVQVEVKVKQYFAEWQQLENQLTVQDNLVKNYASLQRAEEMRFANGESNVFLINAREIKTIEAEQKLIELRAKLEKAGAGIRWAAGTLAL